MENQELKCKKCGNPLKYADTTHCYGGINDNYYVEQQVWKCNQCKAGYIIHKTLQFNDEDVHITHMREG